MKENMLRIKEGEKTIKELKKKIEEKKTLSTMPHVFFCEVRSCPVIGLRHEDGKLETLGVHNHARKPEPIGEDGPPPPGRKMNKIEQIHKFQEKGEKLKELEEKIKKTQESQEWRKEIEAMKENIKKIKEILKEIEFGKIGKKIEEKKPLSEKDLKILGIWANSEIDSGLHPEKTTALIASTFEILNSI